MSGERKIFTAIGIAMLIGGVLSTVQYNHAFVGGVLILASAVFHYCALTGTGFGK